MHRARAVATDSASSKLIVVSYFIFYIYFIYNFNWGSSPQKLENTSTTEIQLSYRPYRFLADRTNGRAIATLLRLSSSSVVCDVMYCG